MMDGWVHEEMVMNRWMMNRWMMNRWIDGCSTDVCSDVEREDKQHCWRDKIEWNPYKCIHALMQYSNISKADEAVLLKTFLQNERPWTQRKQVLWDFLACFLLPLLRLLLFLLLLSTLPNNSLSELRQKLQGYRHLALLLFEFWLLQLKRQVCTKSSFALLKEHRELIDQNQLQLSWLTLSQMQTQTSFSFLDCREGVSQSCLSQHLCLRRCVMIGCEFEVHCLFDRHFVLSLSVDCLEEMPGFLGTVPNFEGSKLLVELLHLPSSDGVQVVVHKSSVLLQASVLKHQLELRALNEGLPRDAFQRLGEGTAHMLHLVLAKQQILLVHAVGKLAHLRFALVG